MQVVRSRGHVWRAAVMPLAVLFGLNLAARPSGAEEPTGESAHKSPEASVLLVEGQITDGIGAGNEGVVVTVHRVQEDGAEGELIATTTTDE